MNKLVFIFIAILLALPLIQASQLKVTSEHPFLVNNEWISASDLKVGDKLSTIGGKTARITGIKEIKDNVEVYNLEAGIYHDFVVEDGLIVHNSNAPPSKCVECKFFKPNGKCCKPEVGYPKAAGEAVDTKTKQKLNLVIERVNSKGQVDEAVTLVKEAYQSGLLKELAQPYPGNRALTVEQAIKNKVITLQKAVDEGLINPHWLGMYDYGGKLYDNVVVKGGYNEWLRQIQENNRKIFLIRDTISGKVRCTQQAFPSQLSAEVEAYFRQQGKIVRIVEVGRHGGVLGNPIAVINMDMYEAAKAADDVCADYVVILVRQRDAKIYLRAFEALDRKSGSIIKGGGPAEILDLNKLLNKPYSSKQTVGLFGQTATAEFEDYYLLAKTKPLLEIIGSKIGQ